MTIFILGRKTTIVKTLRAQMAQSTKILFKTVITKVMSLIADVYTSSGLINIFSLPYIIDKKKPHIKKPLNAFMLYMKEMRAKVVAECTLKESAAINQILGRRVSVYDNYYNIGVYLCLF